MAVKDEFLEALKLNLKQNKEEYEVSRSSQL